MPFFTISFISYVNGFNNKRIASTRPLFLACSPPSLAAFFPMVFRISPDSFPRRFSRNFAFTFFSRAFCDSFCFSRIAVRWLSDILSSFLCFCRNSSFESANFPPLPRLVCSEVIAKLLSSLMIDFISCCDRP